MVRAAPSRYRQAWLAWLVTWVAGCVDAIGYLTLYHIFTANMSGNTVRLGMALGASDWREAAQRIYPVTTFFVGLLISQAWLAARRPRGPAVAWVLVLEALCLLAFGLLGWAWWGPTGTPPPSTSAFLLLAALAGVAMGLQNAAVRHAGALSIHTTHVTGALTRLAGELVAALRQRWRSPVDAAGHAGRGSRWRVAFLASLWLAYLFGAAAGAAGLARWGLLAMAGPLTVLVAAIVVAATG